MNIGDAMALADEAEVVITGKDLKQLVHYSQTLRSGLAPKGEMCFQWGTSLHEIVNNATNLVVVDGEPTPGRLA